MPRVEARLRICELTDLAKTAKFVLNIYIRKSRGIKSCKRAKIDVVSEKTAESPQYFLRNLYLLLS